MYFYILIIQAGISFMWKMAVQIFIESRRYETTWVRKNGQKKQFLFYL